MSNVSTVSPAQDRQGGSEDKEADRQTLHLLVSHFPCVKEIRSRPKCQDVRGLPGKPAGTLSPLHSSVCSARHKVLGMPSVCQSSRQPPARLAGWTWGITWHVLGVFASAFSINASFYTASPNAVLECGTPTCYVCQLRGVNTGWNRGSAKVRSTARDGAVSILLR